MHVDGCVDGCVGVGVGVGVGVDVLYQDVYLKPACLFMYFNPLTTIDHFIGPHCVIHLLR